MTLYEFNQLPFEHQLDAVWHEGTFLTRRKLGRSHLILYALDRFFVEVRYDQETSEVSACRSFSSLVALEPYLDAIQIDSLYSA